MKNLRKFEEGDSVSIKGILVENPLINNEKSIHYGYGLALVFPARGESIVLSFKVDGKSSYSIGSDECLLQYVDQSITKPLFEVGDEVELILTVQIDRDEELFVSVGYSQFYVHEDGKLGMGTDVILTNLTRSALIPLSSLTIKDFYIDTPDGKFYPAIELLKAKQKRYEPNKIWETSVHKEDNVPIIETVLREDNDSIFIYNVINNINIIIHTKDITENRLWILELLEWWGFDTNHD